MKKIYFGVILGLALPSVLWAQKITLPINDYEKSMKDQIRTLRESISDLKEEKVDFSDRRGNLILRILKEDLKE